MEEEMEKKFSLLYDKMISIDTSIKNIERKIHFSTNKNGLNNLIIDDLREIKIEQLEMNKNDVIRAMSYGDYRSVVNIFKKVYKNKNGLYPIKINGPRSFEYYYDGRWVPDIYGNYIMECIIKNCEDLFLRYNSLEELGDDVFIQNQMLINNLSNEKYKKTVFKHVVEEVRITM